MLICVLCMTSAAYGEPVRRGEVVRTKTLRRLDVRVIEGGHEAIVTFDRPLRYVRHSPNDRGRIVRIELAELGGEALIEDAPRRREALPAPRDSRSSLLEVIYEKDRGETDDPDEDEDLDRIRHRDVPSRLILRFKRVTDFKIQKSRDARSLRVVMKARASAGGRMEQILEEAAHAMTSREYSRAASLYELILAEEATTAETREHQRDAREYLGLAHERNGQLAHARAEYQTYLEQYPEDEGADRVRQRLAALITALDAPREKLRAPSDEFDDAPFEFFGDASVGYYRNENLLGDRDDPVYDSTLITDLIATGRGEVRGWDVIGDLAISHDEGFERGGDTGETRLTLLAVEATTPGRAWHGTAGRQTQRDGGVLGRFDGAGVRAKVHERVEVSGVFGFPLESTTQTSVDTDRVFFGTSADLDGPIEGATAHFFAISQLNHDLVDRLALGSELHYVHTRGYVRAFFDFDAYYQMLNLALVSGSVEIDDVTRINVFLQTQTTPFFTLASALQGQRADDLGELDEVASKKDIRELAKDRTAQSYTATLGASRWLTTDLQLSADITFIATGETNATSGGSAEDCSATGNVDRTDIICEVPKAEGTSGDVSASIQLTQNNLFGIDDISSLSIRHFNGQVSDSYSVLARTRLPLAPGLHFDPRIAMDFRDRRKGGNDELGLRPTARLVWDWRDFSFELETGLESRESFGSNAPDHELGYLVDVLIRYEF